MDLTTTYLGLDLKHPVVASPSPISQTLDGIRRLEDAGASAIVMFSLFEEQVRFEDEVFAYFRQQTSNSFPESLSFLPPSKPDGFLAGVDEYLELLNKATLGAGIPIIASLNATSPGAWTQIATQLAKAGASAIELNMYFIPEMSELSQVTEQRYIDIVKMVRRAVRIPIAVKLPPYFSSMGDMARRLVEAGADGLVLFNRLYQPDFDLHNLEVVPSLKLSEPWEIRLPLLWIGNLHGRMDCSLAATTGVHSGTEVAKYVLAGADVTMTTSALLKHGPIYLSTLLKQFEAWCEERGYDSVSQMKGLLSKRNIEDPSGYDRANYIKVLQSYLPVHH